ncbi:glycosyl hydrolase family 28-related protein [Nitrospirillum sp. BR 11164]|uniref:glycosyl hydrolase family 28-related protein n=1 Tax=Nitrospirillum sp. BR 11164 TaxID=3104324 RepID=UPI002B0006A4|nr:glycosyl hydrolase family 28-related protein [Nitrospirillum sp. BR 11164]MEA1649020.1 glycosyl hydrolase family 28-related protein [Nitrospirillum sp. BR 11164]
MRSAPAEAFIWFLFSVPCLFCAHPTSAQEKAVLPQTLNVLEFGADPAGKQDSATPIEAAISAACAKSKAVSPRTIHIPPGSYSISHTINISCDDLSIEGSGKGVTTLFPTSSGDVFFVKNNEKSPRLYSVNFRDFQIYRTDDPKSGAGIHYLNVVGGNIDHISVAGQYIGIEIESSLSLYFNDVNPGGNNKSEGSRLWWVHRSGPDGDNPSENFVVNTNSRAQQRGTYTYGILIQDTDGFNMANYHVGFTKGPALEVKSQYPGDVAVGLTFSNGGFDEAQYCIHSTRAPGDTGNRGAWSFNGVLCELSDLDGFYNDDPRLTNVIAIGSAFFLNGRHGLNLSAGSGFKLGQSIFSANNRENHGGDHVMLSGTVTDVNLDGSSFVRSDGRNPVDYDVVLADRADQISVQDVKHAGATKGDIDSHGSGQYIALSAVYSGRSTTLGADRLALAGTTPPIGGRRLEAGTCAAGIAVVASAQPSMAAIASPAGTDAGDGFQIRAFVSAPGAVTVKVCAISSATPVTTRYNVRVLE